jgi:hypothetical protein
VLPGIYADRPAAEAAFNSSIDQGGETRRFKPINGGRAQILDEVAKGTMVPAGSPDIDLSDIVSSFL